MKNKKQKGKVYITGAGPGDIGLTTLNALEKVKQADVIVFDRLINNELLSFCKKNCEKIFVGKESGHHLIEQDKINEILINKAEEGKVVVRLKGGNPFVFGRGSEEAIELKKADVEYEILPGITSGLSAPIYSGIPITQRNLVTQCIFITAHECPTKPDSQIDWKSLAKLKNTSLIIYMGASRIEKISDKLLSNGMDSKMPVAVIENATLPNQRTITATLDKIGKEFIKERFHAPVIIMISPTVAFRENIFWFEKKKLFNKKIAVAGDKEQIDKINDLIYELGGEVIPVNIIKTKLIIPKPGIKRLFSKENYDWILFSSNNGVKYFEELLNLEKLDTRILGKTKIAVVGKETIETINSFRLVPDYSLEEFNSTIFKNNFLKNLKKDDQKLLRILDDSEEDLISKELNMSDIKHSSLRVFESLPNTLKQEIITHLKNQHSDIFIFTSNKSVDFFFNILGSDTAAEIINNSGSILVEPITPDALKSRKIKKEKISAVHSINYIQNIFSNLKQS